jgi:hypothetical protein
MAYIQGPYGDTFPVLPQTRPSAVEAREIDFATQEYVLNADGTSKSMRPTAQRVLLLISFASGEAPEFLTEQEMRGVADRIKKALRVLTNPQRPVIRDVVVTVERVKAGHASVRVDYYEIDSGISDSVTKSV